MRRVIKGKPSGWVIQGNRITKENYVTYRGQWRGTFPTMRSAMSFVRWKCIKKSSSATPKQGEQHEG